MKSELFQLNIKDIANTIALTVFTVAVTVLYSLTLKEGFDIFSADWAQIGREIVNNALIVLIADLSRRYTTDDKGHILGIGR